MPDLAAQFTDALSAVILGGEASVSPPPPSTLGTPRASVIGHGCMRHVQYKTYGEPVSETQTERGVFSPNEGLVLQDGLAQHWVEQIPNLEIINTHPADLDSVYQLEDPTFPVTATPDFPCRWLDRLIIVECKFEGYLRWKDVVMMGVRAAAPQQYWQVQSQLGRFPGFETALLLAFPFDFGAARGALRQKKVEVDHVFYVEEIQRDEASLALLREMSGIVRDAGEPNSGTLLPRGYSPGFAGSPSKDWQCNYCDFLTRCRQDGP